MQMSRMLRCKAWMTLFGAAAMGVGSAQGHQMLYDQDGYKLAVGIEAGLGGFLVGSVDTGVANGFGRAALYLQPRASFDNVALFKLNLSPVRARLFNLENRVNQDLMQGFDQPKSQFFGLDIAFFEASEAEPGPNRPGEKQAPKAALAVQTTRVKKDVPDLWTAGFEFFHFYDADSTPETFSFRPAESSPALSIFGNRKGLNVYSGYLAGSLFEFDRNVMLYSQFSLERKDAVDRQVPAAVRE